MIELSVTLSKVKQLLRQGEWCVCLCTLLVTGLLVALSKVKLSLKQVEDKMVASSASTSTPTPFCTRHNNNNNIIIQDIYDTPDLSGQ